jgi:formate-dependent nitrite reductase membrane component NrfD
MSQAKPRIDELNRGFGAAEKHLPRRSERPTGLTDKKAARPVYYDVPMLKRSPWKWEISSYFFFGGLSAGSYLLARLAERFGGAPMVPVVKLGTAIAGITVVPCAPLLVKDLGDMSRFHHMLRVFKPESPMNLGTWTMTTYTGAAAIALLREVLRDKDLQPTQRGRLEQMMRRVEPAVMVVLDGVGVPAALLMTSYTGVLLSCTATPVWTRNAWLSPLFVSSAISTAAAAIQVGLVCCSRDGKQSAADRVLEKVSLVGRVTEAMTLIGYLNSLGHLSQPLTRGKQSHHTWLAFAAMVAPELIHYGLPGKPSRWKIALAAGVTLLGGLSLRHGIVNAGNDSAEDPAAARSVG